VGADRTLDEFQSVLNSTVGLNQDHLWFFGTDQDYWDSDVQYKQPGEIEQSPGGMLRGGEEYDAGETAVGQVVRQLELDERDRICYLSTMVTSGGPTPSSKKSTRTAPATWSQRL
jgi:hypothetical protein